LRDREARFVVALDLHRPEGWLGTGSFPVTLAAAK
jgi:hypothetical protein